MTAKAKKQTSRAAPGAAAAAVLASEPEGARQHLILAHGAGAGMRTPFMTQMTELLGQQGVAVARFEFTYMAARSEGGSRRPPPRAETLQGEYLATLAAQRNAWGKRVRPAIGGKSMGGRVASMIAQQAYEAGDIAGLVCLGYPFHPPGQPDKLRIAHLLKLTCPTLIVQGERDPFGQRAEVESYGLPPAVRVVFLGDGDHDFGPRGASGFTRKGNLATAASEVAAFLTKLPPVR